MLPEKNGSGHESLCPYQAFDTADRPILLGVANDSLWRRFCKEAGLEAAIDDPRFQTNPARVAHLAETVGLVQSALRGRSCEAWVRVLGAVGIPCAPINTLQDVMVDPHAAARDIFMHYERADLGRVTTVAYPVTTDGQKPPVRSAPPRLGEHTDSVLRELGCSADDISALHAGGVVFQEGRSAPAQAALSATEP